MWLLVENFESGLERWTQEQPTLLVRCTKILGKDSGKWPVLGVVVEVVALHPVQTLVLLGMR